MAKRRQLRGFDLKQIQGYGHLIGVDEAGRGALAGPVVAAAVVVTMDDAAAASHIVREIRQRWPLVAIHARARDAEHARRLRELGATHCTPEAIEASLQLAAKVLLDIGVAAEVVQRRIEEQRIVEEA